MSTHVTGVFCQILRPQVDHVAHPGCFEVVTVLGKGGWGLSRRALALYAQYAGKSATVRDCNIERNDPHLVRVAREVRYTKRGFPLSIEHVPNKYRDFYEIFTSPHDLDEWIELHHSDWLVSNVKKIISGTGDDKLERIDKFLKDNQNEPLLHYEDLAPHTIDPVWDQYADN